jgi:hypothetical protein
VDLTLAHDEVDALEDGGAFDRHMQPIDLEEGGSHEAILLALRT